MEKPLLGRRAAGSRGEEGSCGSHRGDSGWTRWGPVGCFSTEGVYASGVSFTQSVSRIQPHFRLWASVSAGVRGLEDS